MADPDPNSRLTPQLEASLRRYVLGALDEETRSKLEEQLVMEPDVFEALGVIEDEVIEEYLDGTSTDLDRGAFERNFLTSPQRQARLNLARSVRARASRSMTSPTPLPIPRATTWQPAFIGLAAALALSLAGNLWLVSRPTPVSESAAPVAAASPSPTVIALTPGPAPRLETADSTRAQADLRIASLEDALRRERSRSSASFTLAAGALRGGGSLQRIAVPASAMLVRLRLDLSGDDYPLYRAVVHNDAGEEIWAASKLKAEKAGGEFAVVLALTPDRLPHGDYQVKLSGLAEGGSAEAIGSYAFRIANP